MHLTADLTGKTAVVTGAARGIGEQTALLLAAHGASVYAADRDPGAVQGNVRPLMLDVVDRSSVDAALASIVADHGRIDILVNCAGVYGMQFLADITEAEFDRVIGINLKGLLFVTQAAARHMIEGGAGGTIVNVASAAGRRPSQGSMVYSASKAGVISVTQGAALELASHGIRVNAIAPGAVETAMWEAVKVVYAGAGTGDISVEAAQLAATPLGRLCQPDDCAQAILFLSSDQSRFVTGQTINVDGGMFFN